MPFEKRAEEEIAGGGTGGWGGSAVPPPSVKTRGLKRETMARPLRWWGGRKEGRKEIAK